MVGTMHKLRRKKVRPGRYRRPLRAIQIFGGWFCCWQSSTQAEAASPCADASYSHYEATPDCSGYYHCLAGSPDGPHGCGAGMLYDQNTQRCNFADRVSCAGGSGGGSSTEEDGERAAEEPTSEPTSRPNTLLDWDRGAADDRGHDKTIIGYYASWQWYDRNGLAEPMNMDFTKITRANFAFFQTAEDGSGYIYGTDSWADPIALFGPYDWISDPGTVPEYCSWDAPNEPPACAGHRYEEGLVYLAHRAGAEVYPSIGGWSLSDPFPAMASNPESRARFAEQCVELIKNYNFDGIDIDWEYPGYAPHSGTPDDTVNFNLLLDDIRDALDRLGAETGRHYGLRQRPCRVSVLTELNLMTYDFHGSWDQLTGVNAPLYDQEGSPGFSVHACVASWLEGGAPREKINIGFPFYGRSFLGAEHLYESHQGNDESMWFEDEGVPQYYNIVEKMGGLTSVRDEQTMTQYAFYGASGWSLPGMVSFDDERAICDKTEYAQEHNLGGYIIWELSGDLMPDLSTPLLDAANAKLINPNLDCASLGHSADTTSAVIGGDAEAGNTSSESYYPHFDTSSCSRLAPDWFQESDVFESAEACCEQHFDWNYDNCLADGALELVLKSEEITTSLEGDQTADFPFYASPSEYVCLSDGKQPSWVSEQNLFGNAKECCERFYSFSEDCVAKSILLSSDSHTVVQLTSESFGRPDVSESSPESHTRPTLPLELAQAEPTASPVGSPNEPSSFIQVAAGRFFPIFVDGSFTRCSNTGSPPSWMSGDFSKETKSQCCEAYAFQWDYDDCLSSVASSGHAFASYGKEGSYGVTTAAQSFALVHPQFEKQSCVDDDVPAYMAGDYLTASSWECCHSMFHTAESLQNCLSESLTSRPGLK